MSLSVRTRFEIFKRDNFTCRYCNVQSPDVVLEVDHVVPVSGGGDDDPINLVTACWACNRGKAAVPLSDVLLGEDPHDRAIALLETERQLREYNAALATVNERIDLDYDTLQLYWPRHLHGAESTNLRNLLRRIPFEMIYEAMVQAVTNRKTSGLGYVNAILNNIKAQA